MSIIKEFKEFALKGNVVDLAVGVIIGVAFGKVVTSVVNDIIMPPIGKIMGGVNFADLFINLDPAKLAKDGSAISNPWLRRRKPERPSSPTLRSSTL